MPVDTDLVWPDGRMATWAQVRSYVLADRPLCVICGAVEATEVDHIWPRHFGGTEESTNLQPTCGTCNRAKGTRVDARSASDRQLAMAVAACMERAVAAVEEADQFICALYERVGQGSSTVRGGVLSAACSAAVVDAVLGLRRSQLRGMVDEVVA